MTQDRHDERDAGLALRRAGRLGLTRRSRRFIVAQRRRSSSFHRTLSPKPVSMRFAGRPQRSCVLWATVAARSDSSPNVATLEGRLRLSHPAEDGADDVHGLLPAWGRPLSDDSASPSSSVPRGGCGGLWAPVDGSGVGTVGAVVGWVVVAVPLVAIRPAAKVLLTYRTVLDADGIEGPFGRGRVDLAQLDRVRWVP